MVSNISCVCPRHVHLVRRGQPKAMICPKGFLLIIHWPRMYNKDRDKVKKAKVRCGPILDGLCLGRMKEVLIVKTTDQVMFHITVWSDY